MPPQSTPRRHPMRVPGYDYSLPGAYFVTVVTRDRAPLFGVIADGEMAHNAAGQMVIAAWQALPDRFPGMELGDSIVMPNHFHGIIILKGTVGAGLVPARPTHGLDFRAATRAAPTDPTLGNVVGAFKSMTARQYTVGVRGAGWPAIQQRLWQRGYYDHVIRDAADWDRIHRYILANPLTWEEDEENPAA